MTRCALFDSGLQPHFWCFAIEHQTYIYNSLLHTATNEQPDYLWLNKCRSINDLKVWGCEIYPITPSPTKLESRVQHGYYMGTTNTTSIFKWWDPSQPTKIKYFQGAKFKELNSILPDGKLAHGNTTSPNT